MGLACILCGRLMVSRDSFWALEDGQRGRSERRHVGIARGRYDMFGDGCALSLLWT